MKVFSKRYSPREYLRLRRGVSPLAAQRYPGSRNEFLESSLRIRLSQEINYIVSSGSFVEPFLLAGIAGEGRKFLSTNALQRLSYHELGYDITDYYSPEDLIPIQVKSEDGKTYYDRYFLDLIELIIVFSLDDKRDEVISRIQKILSEENSDLLIYGHMIIIEDAGGLQSITSLLSDGMLKTKLEDILIKRVENTVASREAADVTQYVFSGKTKGSTKKDTEAIIDKIAQRWIDKTDQEEFKKLFNDTVKNIKAINNQISNIRHTDRTTIDFRSPDIHKMIRNLNLAISELAILSTQDDFIENDNTKTLKENYMTSYGINNKSTVLTPVDDEEPINLADIPF